MYNSTAAVGAALYLALDQDIEQKAAEAANQFAAYIAGQSYGVIVLTPEQIENMKQTYKASYYQSVFNSELHRVRQLLVLPPATVVNA